MCIYQQTLLNNPVCLLTFELFINNIIISLLLTAKGKFVYWYISDDLITLDG